MSARRSQSSYSGFVVFSAAVGLQNSLTIGKSSLLLLELVSIFVANGFSLCFT